MTYSTSSLAFVLASLVACTHEIGRTTEAVFATETAPTTDIGTGTSAPTPGTTGEPTTGSTTDPGGETTLEPGWTTRATTTETASDSSTGPDATDTSTTDTSTTGDSTTSDSTTSDSTTSTGAPEPPEELVLSVGPRTCDKSGVTLPLLPEEAGHHAATVLTPPSYPFAVTRVRYHLRGPGYAAECTTTLAHQVQVYVTGGGAPPSAPSQTAASLVTFDVPAEADDPQVRTVELELPQAIVLDVGQSVVVSVQLAAAADFQTVLCIRTCFDTTEAGVDWWSNKPAEPFAWADMVADFGFPDNFRIQAIGTEL